MAGIGGIIILTCPPSRSVIPGPVPLYGTCSTLMPAASASISVATWTTVPTIAEAGLPGFVSEQRYGLLAPAGTPRPIIERLNAELRNALADETIRKRIVDDGATPRPDSPEDYAAAIDQDRTLWGGIVRKLGLRVE